MSQETPDYLYEPASNASAEAQVYVPTELTRGPWDPRAQHGGPVAALLARCLERLDNDGGMLVTRLSVELLRPVTLTPLTLRTRVERPGKRVQLVSASLSSGDTELARATALRMRRGHVELPPPPGQPLTPPAPPQQGVALRYRRDKIMFSTHGVEHRFVQGRFEQPGPAVDWIRLTRPLLPQEPPSALSRVVAAADFGNGVSSNVLFDSGFIFINADLGVYLQREPVGEWFCLDARSDFSELGVGLAQSQLWDSQGLLGRSLQSLLVDRSAP